MSEMHPAYKTKFTVDIQGVDQSLLEENSILEVTLTESLLTPSIQCRVSIQSARHVGYVKDFDQLAGGRLVVVADREILALDGQNSTFYTDQPIYKVSERVPFSYQLDELMISACHDTLLMDSSRRVSKSWKCTSPSDVVSDVLQQCIGAAQLDIESSMPQRTYFAENIHPFQVINQQSDIALAGGSDPSFLHYMTFNNNGTHHFRSLKNLTEQAPYKTGGEANLVNSEKGVFEYREKGLVDLTFGDPYAILSYEFPCDFDILAELMNGFDLDGNPQHSVLVLNPFNGLHSILGGDNSGCGMGGQEIEFALSNIESGQDEGNCEIDVEKYRLNRSARMRLLESDMVALRMTIGFNPNLHVGNMIEVKLPNKIYKENGDVTIQPDYGSGTYLISSIVHTLRPSGFSISTLDCVSKAVGSGMTRG